MKAQLRSEIRGILKNLSPGKRKRDSATICTLLQQQTFWQRATSMLFFAPLPNEVDVWPLLAEALAGGKLASLPRFDSRRECYAARRVQHLPREIVTGQFGIREPGAGCSEIPPASLDLILAPGVAFDLRGHRLGRGRGFYDRLLAGAPGVKCGVAFDEQIVNEVPAESLDVRMDFVLTPTRCVKCNLPRELEPWSDQ